MFVILQNLLILKKVWDFLELAAATRSLNGISSESSSDAALGAALEAAATACVRALRRGTTKPLEGAACRQQLESGTRNGIVRIVRII